MAMVSEFLAAVNQICSERGIEAESVFQALELAVLSAYKKDADKEDSENISVELERETGKFKLFAKKVVVSKVKDDDLEISLKNAKEAAKNVKVGDTLEIEIPSMDFGRIAAQTAKQVILQKITESEKESVLKEFNDKVGQVFNAMMERMQRGKAVFEIGKATATMSIEDQIPNEFYKVGERYKVLLKGIEDNGSEKVLVVSRSASDFLIELFKMEVPEIESGVVEVKACAREAGSRSKIAVISNQEGVDPIGSCVGQRGMRIANVMSELGEEKIDIIEWSPELSQFVTNALSPAKVDSVKISENVANVVVPEDQLSLAIGKDGQNVRLAYKLVGIKIDIQGPNADSKKSGKKADTVTEESESIAEEEKTEEQKKKKTKKKEVAAKKTAVKKTVKKSVKSTTKKTVKKGAKPVEKKKVDKKSAVGATKTVAKKKTTKKAAK